ncbi:MAG: hypothetical protein ACTTKP_06920 [Catonella sp.]|uniref:hypothetical protein n=1 Tax=Catonella sp. TaxID=2382125 RepID=UPI003F9EC00C
MDAMERGKIMWRKKLFVIFFTLLVFVMMGMYFYPRDINISKGEKKTFVVFSNSGLKFEDDKIEPIIESKTYELPRNNEVVNNIIKNIKLYPTLKGLFKKGAYLFDDIDYTINIYIFDMMSGKSTGKILNLTINSAGYVIYSNNDIDAIMSLGFDKKNKADKLKKELEEIIKNEGIKVKSIE